MKEENIQEFLNQLFAKYITKTFRSGGDTYNTKIVEEQGREIVESMFRKFLLDNRDEAMTALETKVSVMEAKVFMYEQIISKSNFAPILVADNKEEK